MSRLAAALCDNVAPCCERTGFPDDVAACTAREQTYLQDRIRKGPGPFVHYDPDAAATCLQAVADYVGRCEGPALLWGLPPEPMFSVCDRVLQGTQQVGESCGTWEDCDASAGAIFCVQSMCGAAMPGEGPLPPVLRVGDPCMVFSNLETCDSYCEAGSYCDASGVCVSQQPSGACTDLCHRACTDVSYCDLGSQACLPKIPEGAACVYYDACEGENVHCQSGICGQDILSLCTTSSAP